MTRGEKYFAGTLITFSGAGMVAGYAIGSEKNNLPIEYVVDDGIALREAEDTTATLSESLPICARAILGTLQETDFASSYSPVSTTTLIEEQCTDGSVSEGTLAELTTTLTDQQMAEIKFEESVDANEYVALEKFNSVTYGFIVGWLSGWVVAGVGYSINERRKYLQPASV